MKEEPMPLEEPIPLTQEEIRQIIREELAAYFDEGSDVLSPLPCDCTQCICGEETHS